MQVAIPCRALIYGEWFSDSPTLATLVCASRTVAAHETTREHKPKMQSSGGAAPAGGQTTSPWQSLVDLALHGAGTHQESAGELQQVVLHLQDQLEGGDPQRCCSKRPTRRKAVKQYSIRYAGGTRRAMSSDSLTPEATLRLRVSQRRGAGALTSQSRRPSGWRSSRCKTFGCSSAKCCGCASAANIRRR